MAERAARQRRQRRPRGFDECARHTATLHLAPRWTWSAGEVRGCGDTQATTRDAHIVSHVQAYSGGGNARFVLRDAQLDVGTTRWDGSNFFF